MNRYLVTASILLGLILSGGCGRTNSTSDVHELAAESNTGSRTSDDFILPENEARCLVVNYWFDPDDDAGRVFTISESDEAVAFM